MRSLCLALGVVVWLSSCSGKSRTRKVRVAAASDLAKAFTELGKEFERRTGIAPEFNFGSSGQLSKQIEQGAPFFLFASANKAFVDKVIQAGRCDAKSARMYARGRVVVWTAQGKPAPVKLEDLAKPEYKRIAIANPEHAPYGVAAKQALEKAGVWPQIADRIVLAENVQATMLYAKNGDADAALVALSLAVVTDGGSFLKIDQVMHEPLDQQLVVCGNGHEADAAHQLAAFISSREGREVMTRYGFLLPTEERGDGTGRGAGSGLAVEPVGSAAEPGSGTGPGSGGAGSAVGSAAGSATAAGSASGSDTGTSIGSAAGSGTGSAASAGSAGSR